MKKLRLLIMTFMAISFLTNCGPKEYVITWRNYDGSVLSENKAKEGQMPIYDKETPIKPSREDIGVEYVFSDWVPNVVEATKDATYTASFTEKLIDYKIKYYNLKDADNPNPTSYTFLTDTISLQNLSKNGYAFNGWRKGSPTGEMINVIPTHSTGNLELYADWSDPFPYTITYDGLGELGQHNNPTTYTVDDNIILSDPTSMREGYEHFDGWYIGETKISGWTAGEKYSDLTITAKWKDLKNYKIEYDFDGGEGVETPDSYTIKDNVTINRTPTTLKRGYTKFVGWYDKNDEQQTIITGWSMDEKYGDVHLKAKYEDPMSFEVTFDANGGAINTDKKYIYLDYCDGRSKAKVNVTEPYNPYNNVPTSSGKYFNGWFFDAEYTHPVTDQSTIVCGSTLYAKWEETDKNLIDTGTWISHANISTQEVINIRKEKEIIVPFGYKKITTVFEKCEDPYDRYQGWDMSCFVNDIKCDISEKEVSPGDIIKVIFTASKCLEPLGDYYGWMRFKCTNIEHKDDIHLNISNEKMITQVDYGTIVNVPDPLKESHTFEGWLYNGELVDLSKPWDIIGDNITLTAKWSS